MTCGHERSLVSAKGGVERIYRQDRKMSGKRGRTTPRVSSTAPTEDAVLTTRLPPPCWVIPIIPRESPAFADDSRPRKSTCVSTPYKRAEIYFWVTSGVKLVRPSPVPPMMTMTSLPARRESFSADSTGSAPSGTTSTARTEAENSSHIAWARSPALPDFCPDNTRSELRIMLTLVRSIPVYFSPPSHGDKFHIP